VVDNLAQSSDEHAPHHTHTHTHTEREREERREKERSTLRPWFTAQLPTRAQCPSWKLRSVTLMPNRGTRKSLMSEIGPTCVDIE
jgi:hypothetical protein